MNTDHWTRAGYVEVASALDRAQDALKFIRGRDEPDWLKDYSLCRALRDAAVDKRSGFEHQLSKELTDRAGAPLAHGGFLVPWEVFSTRALTAGITTGGGYLVDTKNIPAADALRPPMVVGRLGATFIEAPAGNFSLPKETAASTASWLPTETTQEPETDLSYGQTAFSPHTVSAYHEMSRLMLLQSAPSSAEFVARRDLIAVVARALDFAALFGSGSAGQPHGVAGQTGVQTFSGTSLALAGIVNATSALGNALNETTGVAASLACATLLKQRPETTYSTRMLWEGSLVAGTSTGLPARSSASVLDDAMFIGSWNYLNIAVWGGGIEVLVNPFDPTNFKTGVVGMRAMLTCDVGLTWPAAFNYAADVT